MCMLQPRSLSGVGKSRRQNPPASPGHTECPNTQQETHLCLFVSFQSGRGNSAESPLFTSSSSVKMPKHAALCFLPYLLSLLVGGQPVRGTLPCAAGSARARCCLLAAVRKKQAYRGTTLCKTKYKQGRQVLTERCKAAVFFLTSNYQERLIRLTSSPQTQIYPYVWSRKKSYSCLPSVTE